MVDASLLDSETFAYNKKHLVLAFIYIVVGLYLKFLDHETVVESFYNTSTYVFEDMDGYNTLFNKFLKPFEV